MTAPENRPAQSEPQNEEDRLRAELHLMKTAGIIEVAVRNPSIAEYMEHWEGRVASLAAKCEALERERDEARFDASTAKLQADVYFDQAKRAEAAEARVRSLEKENKRLEDLVFVAYQEGWAAAGGHWRSNSGWETSESRAALSDTPREEGKT